MTYIVRAFGVEKHYVGRIVEKTFRRLHNSRIVLVNALAVEEKYEILISNYVDFERELLDAAVQKMAREHFSYVDSFEVILRLNMRLVNLLTAARLYLDQVTRHAKACLPDDGEVAEKVKALCSQEYDAHIEYRFMEALRNYVQHRGIPVHWTQHGMRWTSLDDDGLMEFRVEVATLRQRLEEDGVFKKTVLRELEERIDLKKTTRQYIESLSKIHCSVRDLITPAATGARTHIKKTRARFRAKLGAKLVNLTVFSKAPEGQGVEFPLLLDWDDSRLKLIARNRQLVNLSKRFVVSRPLGT